MVLYNVLKYLSKFLMDETNEKIRSIHRGERVTVCEMLLEIFGCIGAIVFCSFIALSLAFMIASVVVQLLMMWWVTALLSILSFVGIVMMVGLCFYIVPKVPEFARSKCLKEYKLGQ